MDKYCLYKKKKWEVIEIPNGMHKYILKRKIIRGFCTYDLLAVSENVLYEIPIVI